MDSDEKVVLVTGTNGGLGLGICRRLIDEFLQRHPKNGSLRIIFTTRTPKKSDATLAALRAHLTLHHLGASSRISLHPESVDLCKLLSIRALAQRLLASDLTKIDALVFNAGISGVYDLDWIPALRHILLDTVQATTWPTYNLETVGLITDTQLPSSTENNDEPLLGSVFCSNLFGHWLLGHWLMPLLRSCPPEAPGRLVWIASLEPQKRHFNPDDFQGLRSPNVYEHTKRMIDLLSMLANHVKTSTTDMDSYFTPSKSMQIGDRPVRSKPSFIDVHPGICATEIVQLYWLLMIPAAYSFYIARWMGSPWAVQSPYKGAVSPVWAALASSEEIKGREAEEGGGSVKWGSSVTRWAATPSVRATELEGWGINGSGKSFHNRWWGGNYGRIRNANDATVEDVQEFLQTGSEVWSRIEELRLEWENRIEEFEKKQGLESQTMSSNHKKL